MKKSTRKKIVKKLLTLLFALLVAIFIYFYGDKLEIVEAKTEEKVTRVANLENIPEYSGENYVIINDNIPKFSEEDFTKEPFENYAELDEFGRCGIAYANICKEIMPNNGEERGDISRIKPTGWVQASYDGEYLYNRCHLIGYQLSGENDNELNLITGTRYFNVEGMLPFENKVDDYIEKNENNHVLYRVTPYFEGENELANGVQIEAYSIEDNGDGICFNVYIYNVEPGIELDYTTGKSKLKQ